MQPVKESFLKAPTSNDYYTCSDIPLYEAKQNSFTYASPTSCHDQKGQPHAINSSDVGRQDIPAFGVITMPADALAPKVSRASAGMVLDREHALLFQT